MADVYLDHNVDADLAEELRRGGATARTAADLGLERAPDEEHLLVAAQNAWILVSHNRKDFVLLHGAWRRWFAAYAVSPAPVHAGVLIIPQAVWTPEVAAAEIAAFVASKVPLTNELYIWQRSRGWVRPQ